jgi:hypothetical protein
LDHRSYVVLAPYKEDYGYGGTIALDNLETILLYIAAVPFKLLLAEMIGITLALALHTPWQSKTQALFGLGVATLMASWVREIL